MRKPWSISTTVRNPERLRDFLRVLKELEGEVFDYENQIKYQILLIRNKLYKPTNLTSNQRSYFDNFEVEMPFSIAKEIFHAQNYEDPPMRGRNSVAPLNKMGFCIAKTSEESIKITPFGEYLLSEDYDLGKVFLIHFLKWQMPNPDSKTFTERGGFAIKPFIGTLHLINTVNQKWQDMGHKPKGISKEEFSLFAPTLINFRQVNTQAEKLIDYRLKLQKINGAQKQKQFKEKYKKLFAQKFSRTRNPNSIRALVKGLKDYGDNAIRYFRLTRFIHIRGGGFYVDLEPRRQVEINKLIEFDNAKPLEFSNIEEYRNFLADITQPTLPWEAMHELKQITLHINNEVKKYLENLRTKNIPLPSFKDRNIETLSKEELKRYIEELSVYRRKLQDIEIYYESQNIGKIRQYINRLKDIYRADVKRSIELERLVTLALNALNDALDIKPNYPVGDDNEPTFTAPANKPDIECFYKEFNSVCEVTMLTNRSQWFNEGQPVMRHIRDFENQNSGKKVYCLFITPRLHRDTINTFWNAVKHGYEGSKQKIVPLNIGQFVELLEVLFLFKQKGGYFKHTELLLLYDQILNLTEDTNRSDVWLQKIPETIDKWKNSILEN